jgi:protein TilB
LQVLLHLHSLKVTVAAIACVDFRSCEFLNKLDLTVNFINLDHLEASIAHLASRTQLKDLYMIGNPAQSDWPGFSSYVIACLPHLERLDGKEITRSMRITAQQQLPQLKVSSINCYKVICVALEAATFADCRQCE